MPVRTPAYPWKRTAAMKERHQEQELARTAARIPDQATLDAILADYPDDVRGRVAARIHPYLKFAEEAVAI